MYVLVLDKAVPTDEYEQAISGELIDPEEIGVNFQDIGSVWPTTDWHQSTYQLTLIQISTYIEISVVNILTHPLSHPPTHLLCTENCTLALMTSVIEPATAQRAREAEKRTVAFSGLWPPTHTILSKIKYYMVDCL